ncbi:MAG: hypothetical protein ACRDT4_13085, partial [Micromonosporaceae bacterium]
MCGDAAGVPDVVLLDQGTLGSGSTSKAAGGVRAQFSDRINILLGLRGIETCTHFRERFDQEIDLHQVGLSFVRTAAVAAWGCRSIRPLRPRVDHDAAASDRVGARH